MSAPLDILHQLPPPRQGRTGWPWTAASSSVYRTSTYPRITIVTPSYNQGAFLEETIRSVLLQGYPNLEYIVIDGNSSDESPSILQKYAKFLDYWVSEPDDGQANAINKGFGHGSGQIMGWLNSDDMLTPGALFDIAHAFMKNPAVQVITGLRKIVNQESQFVRNSLVWLPEQAVLRRYCVVAQETTYWRRAVWDAIGVLDESYDFAMDYDYWQRMLEAGYTFTFLSRYLGLFRVHESAKSVALQTLRDTELRKVYQHFQIAEDESAALAELADILGRDWRQKMRLLKEFGHKTLSNNPKTLYGLFRLLNVPLIGSAILYLHRRYRGSGLPPSINAQSGPERRENS